MENRPIYYRSPEPRDAFFKYLNIILRLETHRLCICVEPKQNISNIILHIADI